MKLAASYFAPAADADTLRALRGMLHEDVPSDYFQFLSSHNGAELCFDEVDWKRDGYDSIRLFSVEEMVGMRRDDWISEALPALVVVGSDSGGQFLVFDMRSSVPWPLVMYCPGCTNDMAYIAVAALITELMRKYEIESA